MVSKSGPQGCQMRPQGSFKEGLQWSVKVGHKAHSKRATMVSKSGPLERKVYNNDDKTLTHYFPY